MRKKILIFVDDGFSGEQELAHELGIKEDELASELEELCRKGYLKVAEDASKGMCAAGPNLREDAGGGRKFALTEKGKKLIYSEV
jgi:hypothetical protein